MLFFFWGIGTIVVFCVISVINFIDRRFLFDFFVVLLDFFQSGVCFFNR